MPDRSLLVFWARLHDNVPADLLPRWQKVHQSPATQPRCTDIPDWLTTQPRRTDVPDWLTTQPRCTDVPDWLTTQPRCTDIPDWLTTQPRCTDVPDWLTTSAMQPTFWDSDSLNVKCHCQQLSPNRCKLGAGSAWDVVLQPTFWDSDSLNVKCHCQQLSPNRCKLGAGSAWDVVLQPSSLVERETENLLGKRRILEKCLCQQVTCVGVCLSAGVG